MIRLRRLDLSLFGQFTEKSYDFGPRPRGGSDFHIVHGPNEAGKTTTMEGFLRLLYGFPHIDPYAFRHERRMLRVAGVLDLGDHDLALTRSPQRTGNLVDAQGQVLPEQALAAHLGGLALDDYRNLLCLDDETIERGGEEIASAKGDIGRLLFSAAAGIGDLTGVLDGVRDRADALYKKRSSKTRMATLKHELAEVERRIRDEDVTASAYRGLRQARDRAVEAEARATADRAAHARATATARARRDALPKLAEIDACAALIAAHPGFPERLDVDAETLVEMQSDEQQAQSDLARLEAEIRQIEDALEDIPRDPEGLALGPRLGALDELRSRFATAEMDVPKRRQRVTDIRDDMRRAARDLGAAADAEPEALVIGTVQLATLEQAREGARQANADTEAERREIAALDTRIAQAEAALGQLAPTPGSGLDALLARFGADRLGMRHAAATQAVAEAQRQADAARDALVLKGQVFDVLPTCPLTPEEAQELSEALARADAEVRAADQEAAALDRQIAEAEAGIAALGATEGLVGDSAAKAGIDRRDALWRAHRAALTEATALPFEAAMQAVDVAAAARLAQARDLGQMRQLEQDAARLRAQRVCHAETRSGLRATRAEMAAQVADAVARTGIDHPVSAAALTRWLALLAKARDTAQRLDRVRAEHAETFAQAARLAEALAPHLDLADPDFGTLMDAARGLAEEERGRRAAIASAETLLRDLTGDRARRAGHLKTLEAQAATHQAAWQDAVAEAFGGRVAADVLTTSFGPLRELRELEAQRSGTARQIDAMVADQRAFAKAVTEIAGPLGLLGDAAPLEVFADLSARAETAREAEARHKALKDALTTATTARDDAARRLAELADAARRIAQVFPDAVPTDSLKALRLAVDQAQRVRDARVRLDDTQAALCTMLDADDLGAVRAMLDPVTATDLDADLLQLDADSARIEETYRDAIAARSAADRDLRAVTGDADIAALTERRATLELEMRAVALSYLELHLGHELAEEAIRRYRDAHRSGMMRATETAFAELTNDAYTRLRTMPEGDRETLVAQDPSGRTKRAQDMSKGTRFQLYLALRAAAYEQLAQQGTVLPFFCDDIFETFDEDRTRAACRLMARIGRTGQAIYLTHHAHVVEIAREVCGDDLRVHELGAES
ncbi:ATP-binding protein [Roseivivax sp. CAU 1753]